MADSDKSPDLSNQAPEIPMGTFGRFIQLEGLLNEQEANQTLGGRARDPRPTNNDSSNPPMGQEDVIPRFMSNVINMGLSPYHAFVRAWEFMESGNTPRPSDTLDVALTPILGASEAYRMGGVGVFGGRIGAENLAERGIRAPEEALRIGRSEGLDEATRALTRRISGGQEFGGITRGLDQRMRFEIDDSEAGLTPRVMRTLFSIRSEGVEEAARTRARAVGENPEGWATLGTNIPQVYQHGSMVDVPLPQVLNHPTLYQAYPELRDYTVSIRTLENIPGGVRGFFDPSTHHIDLSVASPFVAMRGLIHEVQHAIQRIEGFATGANSSRTLVNAPVVEDILFDFNNKVLFESGAISPQFGAAIVRAAEQELPGFGKYADDIRKLGNRRPTLQDLNNFAQTMPEAHRTGGWVERVARTSNYNIYRAAAGEVEARMAEDRLQMSAQERRLTPVEHDIPAPDQIVHGQDLNRMDMAVAPDDIVKIAAKFGVKEDDIRIRASANGSTYMDFLVNGSRIRVRLSDHQGYNRPSREFDTTREGLTSPEELEAAIRRKLDNG